MKLTSLILLLSLTATHLHSQPAALDLINTETAKARLDYLASDLLQGRSSGSREQVAVARYIARVFEASGLKVLPGHSSYFIPFPLYNKWKLPQPVLLKWNGSNWPEKQVKWLGPEPLPVNELSLDSFTVIHYDSAFHQETLLNNWPGEGNLLLWTTKAAKKRNQYFPQKMDFPEGGLRRNFLLVVADSMPVSLTALPNPQFVKTAGLNIAGWLPGKKWPQQVLAFSAHYDHIGLQGNKGDRIMNGANDNASGITALMMLADYFGQADTASRSIAFMAFSGEELGLVGSTALAADFPTKNLVGMINLEMLGIPQFGTNKVFITGAEHSILPSMLGYRLKEEGIEVINEPDPSQKLFERSDNLPFAQKGVPAHTVMASDDREPCYHRPCDEAHRIDFENLVRITRAIALSADALLESEKKPNRIRLESGK